MYAGNMYDMYYELCQANHDCRSPSKFQNHKIVLVNKEKQDCWHTWEQFIVLWNFNLIEELRKWIRDTIFKQNWSHIAWCFFRMLAPSLVGTILSPQTKLKRLKLFPRNFISHIYIVFGPSIRPNAFSCLIFIHVHCWSLLMMIFYKLSKSKIIVND